MKKFLFLSIIIYITGFLGALIFRDELSDLKTNGLSINVIELSRKTQIQLFIDIIKNNYLLFLICLCGFLTLGFLTFITTLYNGFVFGYLISSLTSLNYQKAIFTSVLPHSFEILGLLIGSAIGFKLSYVLFIKIFLNRDIEIQSRNFIYPIVIGTILITIAAIIEAYVSAK